MYIYIYDINNCEIYEEERVSDHNIIRFHNKLEKYEEKITSHRGLKLIINSKSGQLFKRKSIVLSPRNSK